MARRKADEDPNAAFLENVRKRQAERTADIDATRAEDVKASADRIKARQANKAQPVGTPEA